MAEIKTTRAILGTKTRREVANFPLRIVTLQPRTNMEKTLQPRRKSLSQKSPNEKEKLIRNQNEYSPPHARSNATNVKTNPMTELEIIKERGLGRNTGRSTPKGENTPGVKHARKLHTQILFTRKTKWSK